MHFTPIYSNLYFIQLCSNPLVAILFQLNSYKFFNISKDSALFFKKTSFISRNTKNTVWHGMTHKLVVSNYFGKLCIDDTLFCSQLTSYWILFII